ncbi:ABC transporter ATP-binding protein [Stygiolobus caldivivus]|uniref:ABC transporter ATP-binding protein n=1 Tax=Stygiolobus caldivivus TaxID=2824673 RepID=A0A8D5U611_9CREN|nr:ABC transporter ATP-binding protein [Stygiolobus caldivivus]BCU69964.1 ABC transporter ATP-binding protein [Stygiolobus caldivivus]
MSVSGFLDVRDLSVWYRVGSSEIRAVRDESFSMEKGEVLGIIGESGSGKSTLAKAILRAIRPPGRIGPQSKIFFKGKDLLAMKESEFRREVLWKLISYVPQASQNSLNNTMRVIDHFYDTAYSHGLSREEATERALNLLRTVRLDPERVAKAYPFQLSGGMKQRVLIALSLLLNPELVIMDEAVSSLDVATQKYLLEIIKDINKDMGTSIIFITHDIPVAAFISTKMIVMYAGEIVEEGRTEEIIKKPLHPYSNALMSSVPSIKGDLDRVRPIREGLPSTEGCLFSTRCDRVMESCKTQHPGISAFNGRRVRCFLYGTNKAG